MSDKIFLYAAGPVSDCNEREASVWREDLSEDLHKASDGFIRLVNPVRFEAPHVNGRYGVNSDFEFSSPRGISAKNWLDTERCDLVLCLFPAEKFSLGTAIECGWAIGMRKPVILVTDDKWVSQNPLISHNIAVEINPPHIDLEMGLDVDSLSTITESIVGLMEVYQ